MTIKISKTGLEHFFNGEKIKITFPDVNEITNKYVAESLDYIPKSVYPKEIQDDD